MSTFDPKQFEAEMAKYWDTEGIYRTAQGKEEKKQYCLTMFPYPSGSGLHTGHVRVYLGNDVLARFFRMRGYGVLHPMGWDAFGLPAENAAIKAQKNPQDMVPLNIANFKRQMRMLGLSYDWEREFATTDPSYYRWTQWLFIQFFKLGLLYKRNTPINFCPKCKTGLAEEEVLGNGTHERCGAEIEKKELPQWIFRITTYADRLLSDLSGLDWPEGIIEMQRNWIGKKEGIIIQYEVTSDLSNTNNTYQDSIECFTTRPDTNFGATFIAIAPEHPLISRFMKSDFCDESVRKSIQDYIEVSQKKSSMERENEDRKKTGVCTGLYAVNKLNGEKLPIWISDFVLGGFGTGALVGVPGHDLRDFDFAQAYGLPVKRVVMGKDGDTSPITDRSQVQEESGIMMDSDFLNGREIKDAIGLMMDHLENKGWGKRKVSYHLRDWIFSRQRYWGEPIPMVYCAECAKKHVSWWDTDEGATFKKQYHTIHKVDISIQESLWGWFPLSEQDLPLELPYVKQYEPSPTGESPLAAMEDWKKAYCPECGGEATRETDTMPNWAGSCWYFLRFADPKNQDKPWDKDQLEAYLPVDWYVGGAEHAVLHLLYARFWVKVLKDMGLVHFSEPFLRLRNVGMVLAEDGRKMSKSLGNVINPDDVIDRFGADALRIYEMFMAPFNIEIAWSTQSLQGSYRFIKRIWSLCHSPFIDEERVKPEVRMKLEWVIKKVSEDIPLFKFNTAVAAMMEFLNEWERGGGLDLANTQRFVRILAPFAPFIAEKISRDVFHNPESIHLSSWPVAIEKHLQQAVVRIPVQVNGKLKGVIDVPQDVTQSKEAVEKIALEVKEIRKVVPADSFKSIYVPGRVFNFIVAGSPSK